MKPDVLCNYAETIYVCISALAIDQVVGSDTGKSPMLCISNQKFRSRTLPVNIHLCSIAVLTLSAFKFYELRYIVANVAPSCSHRLTSANRCLRVTRWLITEVRRHVSVWESRDAARGFDWRRWITEAPGRSWKCFDTAAWLTCRCWIL